MNPKISLINLGCPRNLVDSEIILGLLKENGMEYCDDIKDAQVMLINTCAFINDAKEESIDYILKLAELKKQEPGKSIVVIGCLVQRYLNELTRELPEVDLWVSISDIPKIPGLIRNLFSARKHPQKPAKLRPSHFLYDYDTPRQKITPAHYSYIKIAEGCSNYCTYCAISNIKGEYRSRKLDSIYKEARKLADNGVKEINLVAQDTTNYGIDLKDNTGIIKLLNKLCSIERLSWLRILYTHPAHITIPFLYTIANQPKICKYIDVPFQHIDDKILSLMGRKISSGEIKKLIKTIRETIPGVILRTTFIVGFPGETDTEFNSLLSFMQEAGFERLGIFKYSREEGTAAYNMPDQVKEAVKEERFHKAMRLQMAIAERVNRKFLNTIMQVLVEGISEDTNGWFGRTYGDAPEVDGVVHINPNGIKPYAGQILKVRIVKTKEYDLVGEPI